MLVASLVLAALVAAALIAAIVWRVEQPRRVRRVRLQLHGDAPSIHGVLVGGRRRGPFEVREAAVVVAVGRDPEPLQTGHVFVDRPQVAFYEVER